MARSKKSDVQTVGGDQGSVQLVDYVPNEAILNESGQMTAVPEDYSADVHKPLRRKQFADAELFKEWRKANRPAKVKVEKVSFLESAASEGLRDATGHLTDVPSEDVYDAKKYKPLKRKDFASEAIYLRWKADQTELKAARMAENAEKLRQEATHIEKYGDDESRKKIKKTQRLREQLAALEAELESQGISVEDL